MKNKFEYFQDVFRLLLKKEVPEDILKGYIDLDNENDYLRLVDFIGMNMKDEIDWSTCVGLVEAVEHMYKEAVNNGNIKVKK